MTPAHLAPAPLVLTEPAMLHIEWPDHTGGITQVFPAAMPVQAAWDMTMALATLMAHHRYDSATWYVTHAAG